MRESIPNPDVNRTFFNSTQSVNPPTAHEQEQAGPAKYQSQVRHTPLKSRPPRERDPNEITSADVGTALANASAKAAQKYARRGSKAAGVFEAIFDIQRVPTKLQRLFLYLSAYAAGRTHFKAYLNEIAEGYYDEERNRKRGEKRNLEDEERARKAREQRFGALLQEAADWCESRDGAQLLTYHPGICVDGQSERGSFGLPLLDLYARIYTRARSTSSFSYKREAALKRVAEEVLDEFDFPPPPPRRRPRTMSRNNRIEREQRTLQTRTRNLCAQFNDEEERDKYWADFSEGLSEKDSHSLLRSLLVRHNPPTEEWPEFLLLKKEEQIAVDFWPEDELSSKSLVIIDNENKGLAGQLGAKVEAPQPPNPTERMPKLEHQEAPASKPERAPIGQPLEEFLAVLKPPTERKEPTADRVSRAPEPPAEWLSLAELEAFDSRASGRSKVERRFCCPLCHSNRRLNAEHRSLAANTQTGAYHCHRCNASGKLREFCDDQIATITPRIFPAPAPAADAAQDERWRGWYTDAKPLADTPGARYLQGRGIPLDAATHAAVRFSDWYCSGSVLFPLRNQDGDLVAMNVRAIIRDAKRTHGEKINGVFRTGPEAFTATRVAVTEAPIDALALAAAGLPAIALCGTSWPGWLSSLLAVREVLIATDADAAGDDCAARLATELLGQATPWRLRPEGAKDWAEIADLHGVETIAALIEGENAEDHDSALFADEGGAQ